MKRKVMAVYDTKLQAFANPMFLRTIGEGIRMFTDEVNRDDASNALNKHPDDYELRHLADFNDETGEFTPPEEKFTLYAVNIIRPTDTIVELNQNRPSRKTAN